jgi:selenocysteine lyase/cysteine desulfurase
VLGIQAPRKPITGAACCSPAPNKITAVMRNVAADDNSKHDKKRPVVLIGPYEHHSNEVMWRETIAEVRAQARDQHALQCG